MTGWKPEVNVRDALQRMLAWFRKNRELIASVRPVEIEAAKTTGLELGRTA